MMTLAQLQGWLPHSQCFGSADTAVLRVHTDTRTLQAGDLFVALRGERFDANDFLPQATAQGASAVLAERGVAGCGLPGVEVADAKQALGQLATAWRGQFTLPLVAVTGSNGKTTVTQMVAAILRAWKPATMLATEGNFNNDIGVPLTLLRLRTAHAVAVVELGMNHPGEIAQLAAMAQPTVALVNNAQREHLEFMHSVAAVAQENGAVISALPARGVAVFPADDAHTATWQALAGQRPTLTFAEQGMADVTVESAEWVDGGWSVRATTPAGPVAYRLKVAGRHNVKNSLAALACALAAGVPLAAAAQGLSAFEPVKGRSRALQVRVAGHALTLVDDTYNANPDSVRAAIDVLAGLPGPRLLVLGDMGEVGSDGPALHAEVGRYAKEQGIEQLLALGTQSAEAVAGFGVGGQHHADVDALNADVLDTLPTVASVLVKGSRFMKMERVVAAVSDTHNNNSKGAAHAA